jgi:hypothetical protein
MQNRAIFNESGPHRVAKCWWRRCLLLPLAIMSTAALGEMEIGITFNDAGCPIPPVAEAIATRGQTITWQAYDQQGAKSREAFKLYFDPIQGATMRGNRGKVSRPIDDDAPKVEYKYTVVGERCEESPLDPNIRVN